MAAARCDSGQLQLVRQSILSTCSVNAIWRSDVGDSQAGWGDEEAGGGVSNPHYNPELYASYSANVRKNLAHLDENRIDYELLEELLTQLAADPAEGAILLFLPGGSPSLSIQAVLWAVDKVCKSWTLGCDRPVSFQSDSQRYRLSSTGHHHQ